MKKILLTVTGFIAVAMLFTGVGYAAATWLNFTGDEQIKQSESDIDKIMKILEDTHAGKISAESALDELEGHSPKGLVDKIEKLKGEKAILTTDLAAANKAKTDAENDLEGKQEELNNKQAEIEEKQVEINEKNQAYDQLKQQRDAIAAERDNYKAQVGEKDNYVKHLEAELEKANSAAKSVSDKTTEALEKAETYK